jgi:LacI family transcriptional regulator
MGQKVTIQQIADLAGLSKFSVSRTLAGKSGVSNQTRELIFKAAGQLGYFKNTPKSNNIINEQASKIMTGTIVVLFPNIRTRYQNKDSVYWGPIFDGISTRLKQKGVDVITLTEPTSDHVFTVLNPQAIQGIIVLGTVSTQILLDIKELHIPVVMVDHVDPAFQCDTVLTDNFTCMRELMIKMISKGYKDFQFVGNINFAHSFYERWLAYRSVLDEYGIISKQIPELIGPGDEPYSFIEKILETYVPDAFICVNDVHAYYTLMILQKKGIQIPKQCGVTGFDNTYSPGNQGETFPTITTVNVNRELLGMRSVDKMLWRIANRDSNTEKTMIYAEIMMRETTR